MTPVSAGPLTVAWIEIRTDCKKSVYKGPQRRNSCDNGGATWQEMVAVPNIWLVLWVGASLLVAWKAVDG